jgi:hypothetical protein
MTTLSILSIDLPWGLIHHHKLRTGIVVGDIRLQFNPDRLQSSLGSYPYKEGVTRKWIIDSTPEDFCQEK